MCADAPSDNEIIRRVLDGDSASFELIMRRYNQRLYRVVRSIVGVESDVEDVMQEAYFRAYQYLQQFEGRSAFSTWLIRIAVHEATARRRKRQSQRVVSGDAEAEGMGTSGSDRDGAQEASLKELRHLLASAVEALPVDLRLVFTMRMIERMSTNQTAECLDLTTANVKARLHRARATLRSWIDQRIGEEARQLYVFNGEPCDRVVKNVLERIARDPS
ncbi:MAG: RNA polymerase sigma factor [Isosphaeraceae bacterium]